MDHATTSENRQGCLSLAHCPLYRLTLVGRIEHSSLFAQPGPSLAAARSGTTRSLIGVGIP